MKGKLIITSLKEVDGYVHSSETFNDKKYSTMFRASKTIAKCFNVEGTINGRKVRFTSPSVRFSKSEGISIGIMILDKTGWFDVIQQKESTLHRGHEMFDGGSTPNFTIDHHDKIVSLVKVGDEIDISYSIKSAGGVLPIDILQRVRIILK